MLALMYILFCVNREFFSTPWLSEDLMKDKALLGLNASHLLDLTWCRDKKQDCIQYIHNIQYLRLQNQSNVVKMFGKKGGYTAHDQVNGFEDNNSSNESKEKDIQKVPINIAELHRKLSKSEEKMKKLRQESQIELQKCRNKIGTLTEEIKGIYSNLQMISATAQHMCPCPESSRSLEEISADDNRRWREKGERYNREGDIGRLRGDLGEIGSDGINDEWNEPHGIEENEIREHLNYDDNENQAEVNNDEAYFSSYADFNIHEIMLQDAIRTESYRDFIYKNPDLFRNKIVLDIGCGTGILSMFAAKAGAKMVIGVDNSDIIESARDIIKENGLHYKVMLIKGLIEEIKLPVKKVDIIISEWMGYFLLSESVLPSILFARDKYLQSKGRVYPDRYTMLLVGINDPEGYHRHASFWDDVYGFKMNSIKKEVTNTFVLTDVKADTIITNHVVIKEIDTKNCQASDLTFAQAFTLKVTNDGFLHAIAGYFETFFDSGCSHKVMFSTGPHHPKTHWQQTVMYLEKPVRAKKGEEVKGHIVFQKNLENARSLSVIISVNGMTKKLEL